MLLSTFYGINDFSSRKAEIVEEEDRTTVVYMYDNENLVQSLNINEFTMRHAETVAEEWVLGKWRF